MATGCGCRWWHHFGSSYWRLMDTVLSPTDDGVKEGYSVDYHLQPQNWPWRALNPTHCTFKAPLYRDDRIGSMCICLTAYSQLNLSKSELGHFCYVIWWVFINLKSLKSCFCFFNDTTAKVPGVICNIFLQQVLASHLMRKESYQTESTETQQLLEVSNEGWPMRKSVHHFKSTVLHMRNKITFKTSFMW